MNVNSYVFESPYSGRVQVGRPDPSASSKETASNANQASLTNIKSKEMPTLEKVATQPIEETESTNKQDKLLDIYA